MNGESSYVTRDRGRGVRVWTLSAPLILSPAKSDSTGHLPPQDPKMPEATGPCGAEAVQTASLS